MTTGSEDRHDRPTLPHRESVTDKEAVRVITGRPVSACKRCKGRKIKCTYDQPSCQACAKAHADCEYPNADTPTWDQVKALESRLRSVESLLAATKDTHPSPAKSSTFAVSPQADSTAFQFRLGPPSSWQALGRLPSAVELLGVKVDTAEIARVAAAIPSVELSDFPDPEGYDQVLHYFFNKINPFYGILHEGLFRALVPGLWQGTASPQTIHAAYESLQEMFPDGIVQVRQSQESLLYLNHAWTGPPLGRLQSILLMLQYVLRDPNVGDVWDLSGRASRMALELGLHLDPTASVDTPSQGDVEFRRMLFWTTFNCDCLVSCALGRPRALPVDWISTQLPSSASDSDPSVPDHRKEAGVHHARFRLLQADIHERLFAVSSSLKPSPDAEWFSSVQARLDEWRSSYTPDVNEYMNPDRLELHYSLSQAAIYRPCPGNPVPSQGQLYTAIRAAASIMRRYKTLLRNGELHFIWLGVHHVFMAGVTYLNSLWIANRHQWRIVPSYVDAILDIQTCSQVLEGLTAREPGTNKMRDAFEIVSAGVVRYLSSQTGAGGSGGNGSGNGNGQSLPFFRPDEPNAQVPASNAVAVAGLLDMAPPPAPHHQHSRYQSQSHQQHQGHHSQASPLHRNGSGFDFFTNEYAMTPGNPGSAGPGTGTGTGMEGNGSGGVGDAASGQGNGSMGLGDASGFDFGNSNFELERFLSNPFADLGTDTLEAQLQEFFNANGPNLT